MDRKSKFSHVAFALILTIFPGWGHIWIRREYRGLMIFILFFGIANVAFLNQTQDEVLLFDGEFRLALAAAIAVFVFAIVDILRITVWFKGAKIQSRRKNLAQRVVVHYLRSEHGQLEEAVTRLLRIDPADCWALFYLAMSWRDAGETKKARATIKKALRVDRSGYWRDDLRRELQLLKDCG